MNDKKSVLLSMADRFGMEANRFEQVLRATVVPANCGPEQFAAFLLVAKQYNLNPITKEIYAFPSRGGGIQPIVGVDGWMRIINDHEDMDGMEFEDTLEDGKLFSISCRIYRKSRRHPTSITEYMSECMRDTDTWKKWPARMLRHKAAIQAARYAFGFSGIMEPDEYERGPGANLAPTKSAHQARKDGDWETLMLEMKGLASPDELRGWYKDNEERIKKLPRNWQTHLDDEFERLLGVLSPEHPLKKRGRPPKKLNMQLQESVNLARTGEVIDDKIPDEMSQEDYLIDLDMKLDEAKTTDEINTIWEEYSQNRMGWLDQENKDRAAKLFDTHQMRIEK